MQLVRANRPQRELVQRGLPHFLMGSVSGWQSHCGVLWCLDIKRQGHAAPRSTSRLRGGMAIWPLHASVAVDISVSFEPAHKARRLQWQRYNFFSAATN